jgi:hypothetical protein
MDQPGSRAERERRDREREVHGRLILAEGEVRTWRDGELIALEASGRAVLWLTDEQAEALAWELNQQVAREMIRRRREDHRTGE